MANPTSWARGLLHIIDYAVRRGAARAELLAKVSVDPAVLADPDARVPHEAYYDAVEAAAELLGDEHFGLHYIEEIEPGAIDAVGFLAMASETVGEALERIMRFHALMTEADVFAMETLGDVVTVRVTTFGPPRPAHAHVAEMYAADCLLLIPRMTGAPIEVTSFRLAHPAHGSPEEFRRTLGAVPEFSAGANAWSFSTSVLARKMPGADPGLARFFERYLEAKSAGVAPRGVSVREQVRRVICVGLSDGAPSVDTVAQRLKMSARTLQRRLAAEDTSCDAILEEVRRSRATAYLAMALPIAEVSYLLGYRDPVVFHRAFKRWTGTTPSAWRRRPPLTA